jgi:hypothetical protein
MTCQANDMEKHTWKVFMGLEVCIPWLVLFWSVLLELDKVRTEMESKPLENFIAILVE